MSDFFLENNEIATDVADFSSNFKDVNPELIMSPTSEYSVALNWDSQQGLNETDTTATSPHTSADTTLFSPLNGSLQEQDFLSFGKQQLVSLHMGFGDNSSVAKDLGIMVGTLLIFCGSII